MTLELDSLVSEFQNLLIQRFAISSSFGEIASGHLNERRRKLNFCFLILYIVLLIKFASRLLLFWIEPGNRVLILFSKSFLQVMGPVSTVINAALLLGVLLVVMLSVVTRVSESRNRLDFITDLRSFLQTTPHRDRCLKHGWSE